MNDWIRFCRCNRMILTTRQMAENKLCEICQREQADSLRERVTVAQQEEEV